MATACEVLTQPGSPPPAFKKYFTPKGCYIFILTLSTSLSLCNTATWKCLPHFQLWNPIKTFQNISFPVPLLLLSWIFTAWTSQAIWVPLIWQIAMCQTLFQVFKISPCRHSPPLATHEVYILAAEKKQSFHDKVNYKHCIINAMNSNRCNRLRVCWAGVRSEHKVVEMGFSETWG